MARIRKWKQVKKNVKDNKVISKQSKRKKQANLLTCFIRKKNHYTVYIQNTCLNPVVLIDRCKLTEHLILKKLAQSGDQGVSDLATHIPDTNSNMKETNFKRGHTPSIDRLKFIHSFTITTQVNAKTRRVDAVSLPVEKVSMQRKETETVNKKFIWNICNDKVNTLENIFNITSTNTIFKNASLESDTSSACSTSLKRLRTVSNSDLTNIKIVNRCSSRESVASIDEPVSNQSVTLDIHKSSENISSPLEECDCRTRDSIQVVSESSGYHSEQKLSDNSPASSTISSPQRCTNANYSSTFVYPHNFARRTSSVSSEQSNLSQLDINKRKYDFKTPKLPLFKRPPTRIKNFESTKQITSTIRTTNPVHPIILDDSDTISLYAEDLDLEDSNTQCNTTNSAKVNVSTKLGSSHLNTGKNSNIQHTHHVLQPHIRNMSSVNKSQQKQDNSKLDSTLMEKPLFRSPETISTLEVDTAKVNDWIASTSASKGHVNVDHILDALKKLCFLHFRNGKCLRERCWFHHELPKDFLNSLRELTEKEFQLVLDKITTFRYLFKETFEAILMYFKEKDQAEGLIYLIQDILKLDFDKTPYIRKVIYTLKDMGYSFVEAIDEILLTHGRRTQSLLDILLMLIVEENGCLENNWHFIDKLTRFRKDKLDYGVVCEIFQKCCSTDEPNREFCENIYKDLIIKSHIELDKIDRNLVIKYINLLYHFNFLEYAEQLKQNNGIKDHEVIMEKIQEPVVEDADILSIACTSESSGSSTSSAKSTCTNCTDENKQHQDHSTLEENKNCVTSGSCTSENVGILKFSADHTDVPSAENAKEGEDLPTDFHNSSVEQNCQNFQSDLFLQPNQSYTNSDLESYLNYVNRNTYSTNYYKSDELPSVNDKGYGISGKLECISPESEYSKFSQSCRVRTNSYNFEIFIPEDTAGVDLCDADIMKLVAVVNQGDLANIFNIMKKCADNDMWRSFVIHAITALKNMMPLRAYALIVNIFESLENLIPHTTNQSLNMKNLMKMLAFNILPFLDKRKEYGTATRLINIFAKEMDSFVETKSIQNYDWLSTIKMRYVFIFKIFVRDRKLKDALKLLKSSNLNLFQNLHSEQELDYMEHKKRVLNEFIDTALQRDLQVARETILYLMLNMDSLQNLINLVKFLNQLLVKLLNSYSSFKSELLGLIDNITNGWFKYLKHSIMRALLVQSFYDLPDQKLMEFFNLCVEVGIYKIHEGFDNSIGIPKNLLPEEIQFVLHIHFHKICKSNFPLHNIVISMEPPIETDEYTHQISIFTNSLVDSKEMITRTLNVFAKFQHFPTSDKMIIASELITIPYEYLKYFFIPYRTSLPSIKKFR